MDNMQRPAEAELLDEALKRRQPKLSARKAAKAAGISEGWWRQITKGVQSRSTGSIPVIAPAETIARMALAVGVTADELKTAGREDAAEVLPAIEEQQAAVDLTAITDEELAAEFLRRMRGARSGLESAPQSSTPSEAVEDEQEGYDEIDLALPPPEIRHVPETTTVMPDLLEEPEDLGGLAGGPGVGRDVEEDGPDAAAQG